MREVWKNIERELPGGVRESLLDGASEKAIQDLSENVGVPFPADFVDSLAIHDGQNSDDHLFVGEWYLLSISQILGSHGFVKDVPSVRLVPFAGNGAGDFCCLDFQQPAGEPAVVVFRHEGQRVEHTAESFRSWMAGVAEKWGLEASSQEVSGDGSVPSMQQLISIIGKHAGEQVTQQVMSTPTMSFEEDDDVGNAFIDEENGIEVQLGDSDCVETIQIYVTSESGYSEFKGELIGGLKQTDRYEDVRAKLGGPSKSGGDVQAGQIDWDRFDSDQVCIWVGYSRPTGIRRMTLMHPEVAP